MQVFDALRSMYADCTVDDSRATDDFGISASRRLSDGVRLLPVLLHGKRTVLRSRSIARLVRRLDLQLGDLDAEPPPHSVALYSTAAIVRNGTAALVPSTFAERSSAVERSVADAGAGIAEPVGLRLDLGAGTLVVPAGLASRESPSLPTDHLAVGPGSHAVNGVFWLGREHAEDERPATALLRLLAHVGDRRDLSRQELLSGLARLRGVFSPHPLANTGTADLGAVLACLA